MAGKLPRQVLRQIRAPARQAAMSLPRVPRLAEWVATPRPKMSAVRSSLGLAVTRRRPVTPAPVAPGTHRRRRLRSAAGARAAEETPHLPARAVRRPQLPARPRSEAERPRLKQARLPASLVLPDMARSAKKAAQMRRRTPRPTLAA